MVFASQFAGEWQIGKYFTPIILFLTLLIPGILFKEISFDWFQLELFKEGCLKSLLQSILASMVLLLAFHYTWLFANNLFESIPNLSIGSNFISRLTLIVALNILAGCVIEELIFRGFIQGEMAKKNEVSLFKILMFQIFIPSVLFSIMHIFILGHMFWILIFPGMFFSCLKFRTKHISGSIFAHLLFNLYYLSLISPKPF